MNVEALTVGAGIAAALAAAGLLYALAGFGLATWDRWTDRRVAKRVHD